MQSDSLFEYVFASDRHVVRRTLGLAHLCLPVRVRAKRHALLGTAQHRSAPLGSSRLLSRVRGPGASRTLHLSSLRTRSRQKGDFDSSPSACSALVARTWAPRATLAANRHQEASVARARRSMQGATPFTDALR